MISRGSLLVWIFSLLGVATVGSGALCAYAANPRANSQANPEANLSPKSAANPIWWNIPVLCYHTFYNETTFHTPGAFDESYEAFEDLVHYLRENGFYSYLPDGSPLSPEPDPQKVIITFDDGHASQFKAADLLEEYGMRGLFFVIPSLIDVPRYPHMSSAQLASLAERGHMVGVHGHRHVSMPVSSPEIIATLDTVPGLLEEIPGISEEMLHSLAYPYGHYTPAVQRAMQSRYPMQYTVNPGYWDGTSTLIPRILITRDTDRQFFFDYLDGALSAPRSVSMREPNGSRQSVIHFENPERLDPNSLYIRAASPDYDGKHYIAYAAGPFFSRMNGSGTNVSSDRNADTNADSDADSDVEVLAFDITLYLETHHSMEHRALSFAVTQKEGDIHRFVSDGYLIWVKKTEME